MDLYSLKNIIKIRWDKFHIIKDGNWYSCNNDFELTPDDFLNFAKDEYKLLDKKGLVGALSNSKRAIDCQIDWIISYLGFEHLKFNENKYPEVKLLIDEFEHLKNNSKDLTMKLRFIQALGIAPTFLISKIRKLRNKLEHEYTLPSEEDVIESIEVAELFINATENILFNKFCTDYIVQNEYDENDKEFYKNSLLKVSFNSESSFNSDVYINIIIYDKNGAKETLKLKSEDRGYVFFIKASITNEFSYLVNAMGYDIDKKYVKYEIHYA
ncbi:hypothetical protein L0P85_06345 [Terrisporobacter glycolicus]|nr:hypothetical protein L0P85_06345 [Terrisporobacter glycolicus]